MDTSGKLQYSGDQDINKSAGAVKVLISYQASLEVTNSQLFPSALVTGHEQPPSIFEQDTAAETSHKTQENDQHDYGLIGSVDLLERFPGLAPAAQEPTNSDLLEAELPTRQEDCYTVGLENGDQEVIVQPIQETGTSNGGEMIVTGFELIVPGD